jgi:putative nucleotidyltransferase with HDIG domain
MFVEDVFNEKGILLYSANTLIDGYHEIENLRNQGVSSLYINTTKGTDIADYKIEITTPEMLGELTEIGIEVLADYEKKLEQAFKVRQKTISTVRNMLSDARSGRMFSLQTIVKTVEDMVEMVLEEPDVYLRLGQIKEHCQSTYLHSINVSVLMTGFAAALGYSKAKIVEAGISGILHDIGKVKIPESLLKKDGALTRQEMDLIRQHPAMGIEIIKASSQKIPESSLKVIMQHHERINGSGYPRRLKSKQIDEMAIICTLADVYDSLTSGTDYRKPCLPQEALALIFQGSDEEYPRELVEHFTKMLGIYPVGSFVKLATGEMGIVIKINRTSLLTPQVMVLFDNNGERVQIPYVKNLAVSDREFDEKIECSLDPLIYQINPSEFVSNKM